MRRVHRGPILGISVAVLLAVGSATAIFGFLRRTDSPYSGAHQKLLSSLSSARPYASRLSGESSYLPLGNAVVSDREEIELDLRRAFQKDPSAENRAAFAAMAILRRQPDEAARLLREAGKRAPQDPRILNDLAVALLALDSPADREPALEAVETLSRSLRLETTLPALFNQALALEGLGLTAQALAAWERYLEEDSSSGWAREAEEHKARLERRIAEGISRRLTPNRTHPEVAGNPWAARQLGERNLLRLWADQTLAKQPTEAEATLDRVDDLIATLHPDAGRLLQASSAVLREATVAGDAERLHHLALGHRAFARAFLLRRAEKHTEAREQVELAIQELHAGGSPFELRARLLKAWMEDPPDWAGLRQLEVEAQEGEFPSIAAEARRILGYRLCLEGRFESSLRAYGEARRRFEALGEREDAAVISIMRAELLGKLGGHEEEARELATALQAGSWVADPWSRYSIYVVAAVTTAKQFPLAAVAFLREAGAACLGLPERPLCAVDASLWAASLAPDDVLAGADLDAAARGLAKAPPSPGRKRSEIDLQVARARWLSGDDRPRADWEEAVERLGAAAAAYEAQDLAVSAAHVHADRAGLLRRLGRLQDAAAEYRVALDHYRRWDERDRFRTDRVEEASAGDLRAIFEALLTMELKRAGNRPSVAAFLLSEEMRDRLAPRLKADLWLPSRADLDRFVNDLPRGTAVIEYAVIQNQTVAWILTRGRFDQVVLGSVEDLSGQVKSLSTERNLAGWKASTASLFQSLVEPVLQRLPSDTDRLVVVPDSELFGLPFRALWNPSAGRYLDEDYAISLAPSVRQGLEEPVFPPPADARVLSLGFSTFSPDLGLETLPEAHREAAQVRKAYRSVEPCAAVGWQSFRRCVQEADVIHLATHASARSKKGQSWLALPAETVSLERLWAELPDLPRHPLVVLSACETSLGGEGLGGISRPFLAKGASAVVGTLWKIEDNAALLLFSEFHHAWRDGDGVVEALREARVRFPAWRERPWDWGGMVVVARSETRTTKSLL